MLRQPKALCVKVARVGITLVLAVVIAGGWSICTQAATPECIEPANPAADLGKIEKAQSRIEAARAKWKAGKYTGPNEYAGTTETNSGIERKIQAKKAEINKLLADHNEIAASVGGSVTTGRAINANIPRAEQAGNTDLVAKLKQRYAAWEDALLLIIEKKEDELRKLNNVEEAVRNRFNEEISSLGQEIADVRDRAARENACRFALRNPPKERSNEPRMGLLPRVLLARKVELWRS